MGKKQILKLLLLTLLLMASTVQGQRRGRWYQIEKNDVKTVFVDTTTMNVNEEQISVWVLEIYNEPFDIENSSSQAKRSRTQYLFKIKDNSYTVVGNLYYDEIGKIISQDYNPVIGGGARINYQSVSDDENVADIYYKVTEFAGVEVEKPEDDMAMSIDADSTIAQRIDSLNGETVDSFAQDSSGIPGGIDMSDDDTAAAGDAEIDQPAQTGITLRENDFGPDTDPVDLPYKTRDIPEGARVAQIYDPATGNYVELVSSDNTTVTEESPEPEVEAEEPPEYDTSKETNVTNTIFTDGRLFCFQVSSWKRKNIAEREVRKLKNKGHNAFYVEAHPRNKRGTWYRVRVGFFNSREEARQYERSLR